MKYPWLIFYADGSTYFGKPEFAPGTGVQVIAEERDGRTLQHSGHDYYGWTDAGWESDNYIHEHWKVIVKGQLIDSKQFQEIRGKAIEWVTSK